MGYKNIIVNDEVYAKLVAKKAGKESFSSLLNRLTSEKKNKGIDLNKYYGKWRVTGKKMKEVNAELKRLWGTWKLP